MKTNEILTALKLQKNRETTAFAAKLAMLFEFVKVNQSDIKDAAIVETDLNINDNGKVLSNEEITKQYKDQLLNSYRWHCPEIESLTKEVSRLNDIVFNHTWRKEKKNKNAKAIIEKSNTEIAELSHKILHYLHCEKLRIDALSFEIEFIREEMYLLKGCKVLIDTTKGIYSFVVPVQNKFFYALCDLLKLVYAPESKVKPEIKKTIVICNTVFKSIRKAMQFVSHDDLRPAMTGIYLSFEDYKCKVVATNAHYLFYSEPHTLFLDADEYSKPFEEYGLIIAPSAFKKIAALKVFNCLKIEIIDECNALANDIEIELIDAKFPDYKVVIPEYKTYMSFERKDLINAVKEVEPAANKSTSQVTFHLNGNIELNAQDVDFGFENNQRLNYLYKDFEDMDIAFDSRLLKTCLNAFEESDLKMYSGSQNTKAVLFTNDKDTALLMPLMLSGSY
jgi:DNA polymerase III sliding clamp (beta) subunit (PCNA family)